jgi:hypothetical protein
MQDLLANKIAARKTDRKKIAPKRKYTGEIPVALPREQMNDTTCRFIPAPPGSATLNRLAMPTPPGILPEERSAVSTV